MENKDTKEFMSNITDITCDEQNTIERKNVFGKIGTELYERAEWESKCKRLFNKKYKALKIITSTPDMDTIMKTLSKLSSENNGRVLVFRNYDMVNHLVFLGYKQVLLDKKLGTISTKNDVTTYFAYIEHINVIFICHKIKADSNVDQHMRNVTTSIAYFLTLYNKKIKSSEVRIIGLLIQETETEKKLLACRFCDLFSPTVKVFESPTSFDEWWDSVETYNNWWDFSKTIKCCNLFDDLAAQILGFIEAQKPGPSGFLDEKVLDTEDIAVNGDSNSFIRGGQQMQQSIFNIPTEVARSSNQKVCTSTYDASKTDRMKLILKGGTINSQKKHQSNPIKKNLASDSLIHGSLHLRKPSSKSNFPHSYLISIENNPEKQGKISKTVNVLQINGNIIPTGMNKPKFSQRQISYDHVDHVKLESLRYPSCKFSQSNVLPDKKIKEAKTSKEISTLSKKNVSKTDGVLKKISHRHYDVLDNRYPNGSQSQRQYSCEHKTHIKLETQNSTDAKNLHRNRYQENSRDAKISKKFTILSQQNISETHGNLSKANLVQSDDLDYRYPKDPQSFINPSKTDFVEHDIVSESVNFSLRKDSFFSRNIFREIWTETKFLCIMYIIIFGPIICDIIYDINNAD